jgi:hypothetical protein
MLQQHRLDVGMPAQDFHQIRPAVASKADNPDLGPHEIRTRIYKLYVSEEIGPFRMRLSSTTIAVEDAALLLASPRRLAPAAS